MSWLLVTVAVLVAVYVAFLVALAAGARQWDIRVIARLVPHCAVLFKRLLSDPRVPAGWKFASGFALVYLAVPIDLVPDFIPILGQLDDAILVALVLRRILRSAGEPLLAEHWPGPPSSLAVIRRLAFGQTPGHARRAR